MSDYTKSILFCVIVICACLFSANSAYKRSQYWESQYFNTNQALQKMTKSQAWYKSRYEKLRGKYGDSD